MALLDYPGLQKCFVSENFLSCLKINKMLLYEKSCNSEEFSKKKNKSVFVLFLSKSYNFHISFSS